MFCCVFVCQSTFWAVRGKDTSIKVHALQEDGGVRIVHVMWHVARVCERARWTDDMAMREQKKEKKSERDMKWVG